MAIQLPFRPITARHPTTFRPDPDVAAMLTRALQDHPIQNKVLNHLLREALTREGYARKRELAQ